MTLLGNNTCPQHEGMLIFTTLGNLKVIANGLGQGPITAAGEKYKLLKQIIDSHMGNWIFKWHTYIDKIINSADLSVHHSKQIWPYKNKQCPNNFYDTHQHKSIDDLL